MDGRGLINPGHACSLIRESIMRFLRRGSALISLTGHCVPSPLDFPPPDDRIWTFPKRAQARIFELKNKSLSLTLSVVLATNSSTFEVNPRVVEIPPANAAEVQITFSPTLPLSDPPALSIQCPQSGDSIVIPLKVTALKPVIKVDFGIVSLDRKQLQTVSFKKPQTPPSISWPFSVVSSETPQKDMVFRFSPDEVGEFQSRFTLEDVVVEVIGVGVDPPYRISIPEDFPSAPVVIRNVSAGMTMLHLSVLPNSFAVAPTRMELRPNQAISVKILGRGKNGLTLLIEWTTEGHKVVDEDMVLSFTRESTLTRFTEVAPEEVETSRSVSKTPSAVPEEYLVDAPSQNWKRRWPKQLKTEPAVDGSDGHSVLHMAGESVPAKQKKRDEPKKREIAAEDSDGHSILDMADNIAPAKQKKQDKPKKNKLTAEDSDSHSVLDIADDVAAMKQKKQKKQDKRKKREFTAEHSDDHSILDMAG
jgi:hypothetical protein